MPDQPIVYEDVEVLEQDGLGFTCRIGNDRVFIGKYVPIQGTTVRDKGDRGRLALPRWFVEQQRLPLDRHLSDSDVDDWFTRARQRAANTQEYADAHPNDEAAKIALTRAMDELAAAMQLKARRHGEPR